MASTVSARPGTIPPLRPPPQPSLPPGPEPSPDPRVPAQFDSSPDEPTRMGSLALRPGFAPDQALAEQIEDLERWAEANARRDRREVVRFWVLRGTAFIGAATASAFAGTRGGWVPAALGALGALAIVVDAAWSSHAGKGPFRRALFEIRELENTVRLRWDKVRLAHPDPMAAPRTAHALALLDMIQNRREEIGKYVGSVEAPKVDRTPSL